MGSIPVGATIFLFYAGLIYVLWVEYPARAGLNF